MPRKGSKPQKKAGKRAGPGRGRKAAAGRETESIERLNLALTAARMGVWEWQLTDNRVTWSDGAHAILGLPRHTFDGTFETYVNLIHPDDRKGFLRTMNDALNHASVCHAEHRLVWPNGLMRWIECTGVVTRTPSGKPVAVTGTLRDVSETKLKEHENADWKRRHELIAESAGIVVYDYALHSGKIMWSGNTRETLGYTARELGDIDRWISRIHPQDRKAALQLLQEAEDGLAPYDTYYRFRRKKGDYIFIHDRGFFLSNDKGEAVQMLGMMSDASGKFNAEKTIKENSLFRETLENAMPGILYVYDVINKSIVYANRNIAEYLGYSVSELRKLGSAFIDTILHPDDHDKLSRWTNEPDGTIHEAEQRLRRHDGQYRTFITRDTPFKRDASGRVVQVIGVAQDVTDRKKVITQLHQSEMSYRELFESVGQGIFIMDKVGVVIDVNKAACQVYGYEKHELIGRLPNFLVADGRNDLAAMTRAMGLSAEGKPQRFEFWGKKKSGDSILVEGRLTRGTYFGDPIVIGTCVDVTERHASEQALRESEERFRTLQQASFGGIGLHDRGRILDCNQGLSEITGFSRDELLGSDGLSLIAPEWRDFVMEKILSGYDKPYDVEGLRKDGSRYFLEIRGKNIPYDGRVIRVTEFRDITERKKAESRILEQNSKLQAVTEDLLRKNDQLEEFTQIVSHNLRSPVGNISTLLSFLDGSNSEEERTNFINLLKEAAATTLYMLNDLNEVLKIKQSHNIEKQTLSFTAALKHVMTMLNAKIAQTGATVTSDFSECGTIEYPAIYMESIMLNLLDNALKYAHPDRNPHISFKTYEDRKGHKFLEVSDNGLGINLKKYEAHLFKLRKTFHRHAESRGVGLFMVKNQVEAMGGEITVKSEEGQGSTFLITFNKQLSDGN